MVLIKTKLYMYLSKDNLMIFYFPNLLYCKVTYFSQINCMLNGYGNFKKVYVMVSDILIKEQNDTSNPTPQQLSNGWKKKRNR